MKEILIVDCSPELFDLFTMILQKENIKVRCCSSIKSMFQSLQLRVPDLLILDVFACGIDQRFIA